MRNLYFQLPFYVDGESMFKMYNNVAQEIFIKKWSTKIGMDRKTFFE